MYHRPRKDSRDVRGVGIMVKKCYNIISKTNLHLTECETMKIITSFNHTNLIIYRIYRPPNSEYNIFLNDYFIYFTNNPVDQNTIILGDFNIPLNHNNSKAIAFINILYLLGHHQHVSFPTHQHGNILDLIITTNDCTL